MWENDTPDAQIKVIDFGLSKKFGYGEENIMRENCGTIYTMAPQVLQGVYTSQADLWSVGVVTYMLLSSESPFLGTKRREVIDKVMRGDYTLDSDVWKVISDEAKDMVTSLLVVDPEVRLTAASALLHKWLLTEVDLSDGKPSKEIEQKVKKSLMMYQNSSKLKKIALNVSNLCNGPNEKAKSKTR
jgi:serine/threonine protein kinase